MTTRDDAILIGGPHGESLVAAGDSGLVELELDGLIHRYIRTTATREVGGGTYRVYNYDGEVAADGGSSGSENARDRVASPLAAGQATELPSSRDDLSGSRS
ncbi:hypothetical protein [Plantactinospora sp. KLBMP9567]|uniref:hypothetical protein n=1 Tax=Plantactinospora sp. KLBMP9567 TaxID=3085900 RepID=UPI002981FEFD|nr:hypothetical protein [Plantactinospora sp. KLBMP9567]MDW5322410.1 hypothetical protein [Plantactinospora sp. KLBMP9567]